MKIQVHLIDRKEEPKRANTVVKPQQLSRPEEPLKYFLGPGNNSELIKRVLRTRSGWIEAQNSKEMFVNLRWSQTNKNFKYQSCIENRVFRQSLNHLEYHQQLSNKEYLFKNVYEYCQHHKLNIFQFVPLTFVLNLAQSNFEQQQLFFRNFYNKNRPHEGQPEELYLRRRRMNPNNFFNCNQKTGGVYCKYQIKDPFAVNNTPYLWILKPTFYNRGNGVHVFSGLAEMEEIMSRYMHGVPGNVAPLKQSPEVVVRKSFRIREVKQIATVIRSNSFVVQKYIEKPMLVGGRKFDIRVWVLVTHELKVYLFRQGYLRTSSYQYSLAGDKATDLNIHLTNNAVQKYNDDYGLYESGNQLSFDYLRDLLKQTQKCYEQLMVRLKDIIRITMLSVRKKINKHDRSYCFQIFGYDFMLDYEGNPWLIEVNTNPCLEESSPILQELLPRMIDDCFSLTIDQIFDQKQKHSCFSVEREPNQDNLWDFVVDLKKN